MTIKDLLHETSSALLGNKVRSGLTVLGIIIGIGSVITMLGVGQGATNSIQASIESIGSNLLLVTPGAQRTPGSTVSAGSGSSQTLKRSNADAIASQIPTVKAVAPDVTTRSQVTAAGTNTNTSIIGTTPAYLEVRNIQVGEGSFFDDIQVQSLARVAVIGPTTRDTLFGVNDDSVGKTIRVKGVLFTVIGVTAAKGGSGFNNTDDRVYVPITVASQYLVGDDHLTTISIEVDNTQDIQSTQDQVTSLLLQLHNINDPTAADFTILNQQDILSTASSVTTTLTILLASIAGISLLVGGIGIMNMMLTTVTERTREIGLRKAIGAKKHDIRMQFLVESVMLTFVGGLLGVLLGVGLAFAISLTGLVQAQISLFSVVLSFGVSAAIGIIFGYYPAARASSLNPIEALRYE
jgi:putative ABC transport system permease protein